MRGIPPITGDLRQWAQALTRALQGGYKLPFRNTDSSAAEDGVLAWDPSAGVVVVTDNGAWVAISSMTITLGPFHINDLPGNATTQATQGYFNTATALSRSGVELRMPRAGRVVGLMMTSDAARTAGTATARIRINGTGTAFDGGSVQLNAAPVAADSSFVSYANGVAFAANDTIGADVVTSGWTPTTANVNVYVVVMLDPF